MDASAAGEGKLAFTLRVPVGVVGAISPFNFPLNLVAHKLAPAIAAGCPVVLKPASQTPLSALRLAGSVLDECGLPAGQAQRRHRRRRHRRQRDRRPSRHRHDHIHRLARGGLGHPLGRAAQEGRARARQQRAGDHRAAARLRDGCGRRSRWPASPTPGSRASRTQRVYVHESIVERSSMRSSRSVERLVVGRPLDEQTDVSALISKGERDRGAGVGRRGR